MIPYRAIAACLLLAGCCTPELSAITPIPEDDVNGVQAVGVGDVIFLTNTLRGNAFSTAAIPRNSVPPLTQTVRIPLRHVSDPTNPKGHRPLTPNENALLIAVLAVNAYVGPLDSVTDDLNDTRGVLWDVLVDNLRLVRNQVGEPAQLKLSMDGFCPAVPASIKARFFPDCKAGASPGKLLELQGLAPVQKGLDAVTLKAGNLAEFLPYYQPGGGEVAVSAAQLVRNGAVMHHSDGDEARWSLADWQASGICGKDHKILSLRLRSDFLRYLWIVPKGSSRSAQWKLSIDNKGVRTAAEQSKPGRVLNSIAEEDLNLLFPGDVADLEWGTESGPNGRGEAVALSSPAREACLP